MVLGFVGGHLVVRLLAEGFEVWVFYPKMGLEDGSSKWLNGHLHVIRAIKRSVL